MFLNIYKHFEVTHQLVLLVNTHRQTQHVQECLNKKQNHVFFSA